MIPPRYLKYLAKLNPTLGLDQLRQLVAYRVKRSVPTSKYAARSDNASIPTYPPTRPIYDLVPARSYPIWVNPNFKSGLPRPRRGPRRPPSQRWW